MTIASEITKLITNLANCYTKCTNKGATLPQHENFDNLADTIDTIITVNNTTLSVNPTTSVQSYTPSSPYTGYGSVSVAAVTYTIDPNIVSSNIKSGVSILGVEGNVIELKGETKTINPSTSTQTITPSAGKNGITSATVNPVTSAIDANIQAGNIKKDVQILGVIGTFEGGASTRYGADIYAWTVNSNGSSSPCNTNISFDGLRNANTAYFLAFRLSNMQGTSRTVTFPDLESATGEYCFYEMGRLSVGVTGYYFPKLKTCGTASNVFDHLVRESASAVYLPALETADGSQVFNFFKSYHNTNSQQGVFSLDKLSSIKGSQTFYQAFFGLSYPNFKILFPSLNKNSFGSYTNQFANMLQSSTVAGVEVHFPPSLAKTLINFDGVSSGYGNTNARTYFDLGGTVNFSITPNTAQIYIYDELVENNVGYMDGGQDGTYTIIDSGSNTISIGVINDVETGETYNVTKDLTTGYNTITFQTTGYGANGLAIYGNQSIPMLKSSNDFLFRDKSDVGTELSITIYGDENHSDYHGTVTTTGSDITQSITLGPATWAAFVRPNLTSNGTMGGTSFAVSVSSVVSTADNRQAYRAVDGSTSTSYYWQPLTTDATPTYTFYNPSLLKVTELGFRWTSSTYRATQVVLSGSKDGSTWTTIGTYALAASNIASASVDGTNGYNYFRMVFTKNGTYTPRLVELTITATEKT